MGKLVIELYPLKSRAKSVKDMSGDLLSFRWSEPEAFLLVYLIRYRQILQVHSYNLLHSFR